MNLGVIWVALENMVQAGSEYKLSGYLPHRFVFAGSFS
jgi:hypothetical protein